MMWNFIKKYPLTYWRFYVLGFFALLITNYLMVLIPLKIRDGIDLLGVPGSTQAELRPIVVSIIFLAIFLAVSRTASRMFSFMPGWNVEADLRRHMYQHVIRLTQDKFRDYKIGDLMSRMMNDIRTLRQMVSIVFLHITNTTLIYSFVLWKMMGIDVALTLKVLIPVPVSLLLAKILVGRLFAWYSKSQKKLADITNYFVEILSSILLLKSYAAEPPILDRFSEKNQEYLSINITLARLQALMFPLISGVSSITMVLLLLIGGNMIISEQLTVGELVAITSYLFMLAWPTAALGWILNVIQQGKSAHVRVNEIMTLEPAIADTEATDQNIVLKGAIKQKKIVMPD